MAKTYQASSSWLTTTTLCEIGIKGLIRSNVVFSDHSIISIGEAKLLCRTSKTLNVSKANIECVQLYISAHFDPKISFEVSKTLSNKYFCVVYDHFSGSMLASVNEIHKLRRCSDGTENWSGTLKFCRVFTSAEAVNVVKHDKHLKKRGRMS
jgi:hypothetical protein